VFNVYVHISAKAVVLWNPKESNGFLRNSMNSYGIH
jgi:hypothetical protein